MKTKLLLGIVVILTLICCKDCIHFIFDEIVDGAVLMSQFAVALCKVWIVPLLIAGITLTVFVKKII